MDLFAAITSILNSNITHIVLVIIVLIMVHFLSAKTIDAIIKRTVKPSHYRTVVDEHKREQTLSSIFKTATTVAVWTIGIIVILSQLGVNIAALATGAGILGVVIGFGAQNTIRDYLAGIFIIAENQYRVGDIVAMSGGNTGEGKAGVVEEITIRITRLRDLDGVQHIVRNGEPAIVSNLSLNFANVNVDVGVAYDTDIDKAEQIINKVGKEQFDDPEWKDDIIEPIQYLRLDEFSDSSVILKSLGKVQPARQWDIAGDFRRRLKKAFEREGVVIPFPQIVVHEPKPKHNK